jgi:3-hydroxymyristoyl/3-hydroxydecanoyl-(acyl carrier protein) dehydratase
MNQSQHSIDTNHPSLPGHFPGHPIVPGVVILTEVYNHLTRFYPDRVLLAWQQVKFRAPLGPAQQFVINSKNEAQQRVSFSGFMVGQQRPFVQGFAQLGSRDHGQDC